MATPPPLKDEEELYEMDRDELVDYAVDRQRAAYEGWERMMGDDL